MLTCHKPFIMALDDQTPAVGKTCKSYNFVAQNNLFSVKINSHSLAKVTGPKLFRKLIEESFKRHQELEIT